MRELLERLELFFEAVESTMDAEGFKRAIQMSVPLNGAHSFVTFDTYNEFSRAHDQVSVMYFGVPESASVVQKMNNRGFWTVSGFSKELGQGPPKGKVKLEMTIAYPLKTAGQTHYRSRAKTGTPEQVAKYLAAEISKIEGYLSKRMKVA